MPIYDYKCGRCSHKFEQLVKPGEKLNCPSCGARNPERLFPFSAVVSTGRTRERSLAVERGKARVVKRDKDHAHSEYLRKHNDDHG